MGIGGILRQLSASTLRKAWRFAHALSETKNMDEVTEIVFNKMHSIVPHETAVLYAQDPATYAPLPNGFFLKNIDGADENVRRYNEYYFHISPVLPTVGNPRFSNIGFTESDVVGKSAFLESEYYRDFFKPMGLLHTMVLNAEFGGKIVGNMSLHRPAGAKCYSEKEKAALTLIAPAISGALFGAALRAGFYDTPVPATLALLRQNGLSPREEEITGLILRGLSNKEIGQKLFISEKTVKTHINSILQKTGARNRVALISSLIARR